MFVVEFSESVIAFEMWKLAKTQTTGATSPLHSLNILTNENMFLGRVDRKHNLGNLLSLITLDCGNKNGQIGDPPYPFTKRSQRNVATTTVARGGLLGYLGSHWFSYSVCLSKL